MDAEGYRSHPYRCTANKLTIGYGRNLEDNGISREEGKFLLANDLADVALYTAGIDYFDRLDPVRQLVVSDMVYNLGAVRFGWFRKFNAALAIGDYTLAAHEMMDSKWYTQVGRRAKKLREAMITGIWK